MLFDTFIKKCSSFSRWHITYINIVYCFNCHVVLSLLVGSPYRIRTYTSRIKICCANHYTKEHLFGGESWNRTKCPEGMDLQSTAVTNAAHSPIFLITIYFVNFGIVPLILTNEQPFNSVSISSSKLFKT